MSKHLARALLSLGAIEAICFGQYLLKTGFYLDDYVFLHRVLVESNGHLLHSMRAFASASLSTRPLDILHFPLLIWLGKLDPWRYRLIGIVGEILLGLYIMLMLRRLVGAQAALLAAVLALAFPNHEATHYWFSQSPQLWAMVLGFMSLSAHQRFLTSHRHTWLFGAQALYLIGMLHYESIALMPGMLAAALWARERTRGASPHEAAVSSLRAIWPYAASAMLILLYQVVASTWWQASPKTVDLSLGHAFKIYDAALRGATSQLVLMLLNARFFIASPLTWLALPLVLLILDRLLTFSQGRKQERRASFILAVVGMAGFLCAYLPYVFAKGYVPSSHGVMSRLNMGGGIAMGLLLASGLLRLSANWGAFSVRRASLAALLAAFSICHWMTGWQWRAAWEAQKNILADINAGLPADTETVLLLHTRSTAMGAPVFWSHYDITYALRLKTARPLRANWVREAIFEKDTVVVINGEGQISRYPYHGLYIYDALKRTIVTPQALIAQAIPKN